MNAKRVVRDVAKVLGMSYSDADKLAKMIPDGPKVKLQNVLDTDEDFRKAYEKDAMIHKVIDMSLKLEGNPRDVSVHASGIVIASEPISKYIPMCDTKDKGMATMFDMVEIESLGMLKFDFLGLRNLTVIDDTINMIKRNYGTDIDISRIDFTDQKVYRTISSGNTVGIFQLEAKGMTEFMTKLKPTCFEDIIAGVSLYRPGPMDDIPTYLDNRRHPEDIRYACPELEPILKVTYGCTVYQEQVMEICRKLAGYSYGRADLVRRAMSKKKEKVMLEEKEYFVNGKLDENGNVEIPGCVRNGIDKKVAEDIYDGLISFAAYAFNKSHAAAYSMITYETAWLKTYYPSEFMAALMTNTGNLEHVDVFIKDAVKQKKRGKNEKIKVIPPHILYSTDKFEAMKNGNILFGLGSIKGVGESVAKEIAEIDRKPYRKTENPDILSFFEKLPKEAKNKRVMESLSKSGALNDFFGNSNTALLNYPDVLKKIKGKEDNKDQISMFDTGDIKEISSYKPDMLPEYPRKELLKNEREYLGTYLTGHPLSDYSDMIKRHQTYSIEELVKIRHASQAITFGLVTEVKKVFTRKGDKMAFVTVSSENNTELEVVVFPKAYKDCEQYLEEDNVITISGEVKDGKLLAGRIFIPDEFDKI